MGVSVCAFLPDPPLSTCPPSQVPQLPWMSVASGLGNLTSPYVALASGYGLGLLLGLLLWQHGTIAIHFKSDHLEWRSNHINSMERWIFHPATRIPNSCSARHKNPDAVAIRDLLVAKQPSHRFWRLSDFQRNFICFYYDVMRRSHGLSRRRTK